VNPYPDYAAEFAELSAAIGVPLPATCYPYGPRPVDQRTALRAARDEAAQAAYEAFEFWPFEVQDAGGWDYVEPGREWKRTAYLETGEPGADSIAASFTVVFAADDSAEIVEVYALDRHNGTHVGKPGVMGDTTPAP
jgi:hypothetical protein